MWPNCLSYIALISFMQVNFACTGKEKFSDIGIQALDTNMKMPRKLFILTGFFCAVSGKVDVDMADFTLR